MQKNIYEIFEEFEKAPTTQDKANVLRFNANQTLLAILRAAFHPNIKFLVNKVPNYKPSDAPVGLGYTTLHREITKIYLFEAGNPRRPTNLSDERMQQLLIQLLESLEAKEAVVFMNTLLKNLRVPGLDESIIKMAFPDRWHEILG